MRFREYGSGRVGIGLKTVGKKRKEKWLSKGQGYKKNSGTDHECSITLTVSNGASLNLGKGSDALVQTHAGDPG